MSEKRNCQNCIYIDLMQEAMPCCDCLDSGYHQAWEPGYELQIAALQGEIAVYKGALKALNEQLAEKDKEIERLKECWNTKYIGAVEEHSEKVESDFQELERIHVGLANKYNALLSELSEAKSREYPGYKREKELRCKAEAGLAERDKEIERLKEQNDKFMWQVRDTCARAEKAEAENAALRDEINNPKRTFCAWCGYTVEIDDDAATGIAEHVRTCEKHPLNIEIDALRERLRPVEEVYKKFLNSDASVGDMWQAICKAMEGK